MPLPNSHLELTIKNFEKKAREYHCNKLKKANTKAEREKLNELLSSQLDHLNCQRRSIDAMVSVQYQLALYQQNNRGTDTETDDERENRLDCLDEEGHHPTEELMRNMHAVGDISPDKYCACHHIVQGKGRAIKNKITGKYIQSPNAIKARTKLHMMGIGINDPSNGVWLPKKMDYVPHWAMPRALPHANIHTLKYEEHVLGKIQFASNEQHCRAALLGIKDALQDGSLSNTLTKKSEKRFLGKVV